MAAELISFGTVAKWISQLWRELKKIRKYRHEELEKINDIVFGDPVEIARYYVEPDCQDRNPADTKEEDSLLSTTPVMKSSILFFVKKASGSKAETRCLSFPTQAWEKPRC